MRLGTALFVGALVLGRPAGAIAQAAALEQRCTASGGAVQSCRAASSMLDVLAARSLRVSAGGNAVAGTASTIGRRAGTPRVAFTARVTAGSLELPELDSPSTASSSALFGFHGDLAIGVLEGVSPTATVSGLGSLDLLASAGAAWFADSHGFESTSAFTWAAGLRLGVLRESFTAPGVALTAMYRRMSDVRRGDLATSDLVRIEADQMSAWDASAVVGKRIAVLGLSAGGGYMRYRAEGALRVRGAAGALRFDTDDINGSRAHLFANVSWTVLLISLIGELGWQSSGGGTFGGVAARLTF
jgi:hypothetical protein